MTMTNKEIIARYKESNGLPADYELYSPQAWYKQGYRVKKGRICKHRVKLCPAGKHYLKEFSLFSCDQVEKRV